MFLIHVKEEFWKIFVKISVKVLKWAKTQRVYFQRIYNSFQKLKSEKYEIIVQNWFREIFERNKFEKLLVKSGFKENDPVAKPPNYQN